ncbi:uncharacterized protein PSFLO_03477 [Pseudozyma flocculosa]|uniref:Uncharacterized protein n=1 Tax=Pseudozyma flocculosa TaxID=84751 RepID=A0A5C3F1Q8_9BASI|nr:uncharacterized protein PSFLO_03477 [Pseudozyma flocculosa]
MVDHTVVAPPLGLFIGLSLARYRQHSRDVAGGQYAPDRLSRRLRWASRRMPRGRALWQATWPSSSPLPLASCLLPLASCLLPLATAGGASRSGRLPCSALIVRHPRPPDRRRVSRAMPERPNPSRPLARSEKRQRHNLFPWHGDESGRSRPGPRYGRDGRGSRPSRCPQHRTALQPHQEARKRNHHVVSCHPAAARVLLYPTLLPEKEDALCTPSSPPPIRTSVVPRSSVSTEKRRGANEPYGARQAARHGTERCGAVRSGTVPRAWRCGSVRSVWLVGTPPWEAR